MSKNIFSGALCVLVLALSFPAEAQQPKKVPRIGFLHQASFTDSQVEAFRQGLRDLGYVEGKNFVLEYRSAEGRPESYPDLATELVRLNVDMIVVSSITTIRAAENTTKTIPIVMFAPPADPGEAGLIESLAHPGGNITGMVDIGREIGGKRLELLKQAVPKVARVAVLYDPAVPRSVLEVKEFLPGGAWTKFDCSVLGGTRCGQFR